MAGLKNDTNKVMRATSPCQSPVPKPATFPFSAGVSMAGFSPGKVNCISVRSSSILTVELGAQAVNMTVITANKNRFSMLFILFTSLNLQLDLNIICSYHTSSACPPQLPVRELNKNRRLEILRFAQDKPTVLVIDLL